jgi:hypothetical protein
VLLLLAVEAAAVVEMQYQAQVAAAVAVRWLISTI